MDQLPPEIREEFEKKLIANGFGDYSGLAAWLQERGFNVSRSATHRAGQKAQEKFEEQLKAVRIATAQAKAIAEAAEGEDNLMGTALTRICQEKTYQLLQELQATEGIGLPTAVRMVADLNRSEIDQKRWIKETREKAKSAAEEVAVVVKKEGLSEEKAMEIRKKILGIV